MHHHRFAREVEWYRLPEPPIPALSPEHFVFCPFALAQAFSFQQQCCQWMIYQMAFEQARAVARPSILERDLLAVWN